MLKTPRLDLIHGLYCRSVEYGALFNFDNVCISWTIVIALVVIIQGSQENYIKLLLCFHQYSLASFFVDLKKISLKDTYM